MTSHAYGACRQICIWRYDYTLLGFQLMICQLHVTLSQKKLQSNMVSKQLLRGNRNYITFSLGAWR